MTQLHNFRKTRKKGGTSAFRSGLPVRRAEMVVMGVAQDSARGARVLDLRNGGPRHADDVRPLRRSRPDRLLTADDRPAFAIERDQPRPVRPVLQDPPVMPVIAQHRRMGAGDGDGPVRQVVGVAIPPVRGDVAAGVVAVRLDHQRSPLMVSSSTITSAARNDAPIANPIVANEIDPAARITKGPIRIDAIKPIKTTRPSLSLTLIDQAS